MSIYNAIFADWTSAIKMRDSVRATALANIKANLLNKAVELKVRQVGLTDEQTITVLQKLYRQSEDTIQSFPPNHPLSVKEQGELSIISSYLPRRLPADEVRDKVYALLLHSGASDMGAAMKVCMATLKSVADGKQIQFYVQQFLEEKTK